MWALYGRPTACAFVIEGLDVFTPFVPDDDAIHTLKELVTLGRALTHAVFDVAEALLSVHNGTALPFFYIIPSDTLHGVYSP